jgi:cytochrome c-type biogenesis protein CcmH
MSRPALSALLAALALLAAPALAAACPRASLPDVEDEVMCPVCGTPLNVSESPQAARERAFIRRRIGACASKEQIKRELVAQFGSGVLALPEEKGFNLAAYLVPLAAVLAALAGLAVALPRWRRARSPGPPERSDVAAADARRLDEDIARYDL